MYLLRLQLMSNWFCFCDRNVHSAVPAAIAEGGRCDPCRGKYLSAVSLRKPRRKVPALLIILALGTASAITCTPGLPSAWPHLVHFHSFYGSLSLHTCVDVWCFADPWLCAYPPPRFIWACHSSRLGCQHCVHCLPALCDMCGIDNCCEMV